MAVTPTERKLARLLASDTAKYERRCITAAARLGFKAQQKATAAWKAGRRAGVVRIAIRELMRGKNELRDAMVLAYVLGKKRSGLLSLSLSAADSATKILRKQARLTATQVDEIRELYDAEAFRVLANVSHSVESKLQRAVAQAVEEGAHMREGTRILGEAFEAAGITPRNSFQLETIFRTQMQMAYSAAKWQGDQDPGIQEILWGYKYMTVGDDRVRPEHEGLDGVTLPKDHAFWNTSFPPNGWCCRCQALEIFNERGLVEAPESYTTTDEWGQEITVRPGPDEGFDFNPGHIRL